MASNQIHEMKFQVAPDKLLEIVTSEDFQKAREKKMGALEVRVEERERSDDSLVFDVHTVDYARGMTGIDKSKQDNNRTEYKWNLGRKRAEWTYFPEQNKMVKAWGTVRVEPDGEHAKLINEFNVNVKVPLMGGKIEKMVLREVAKSWVKYEQAVREFL